MYNLEAEQAVIGSLLIDPEAINKIPFLKESDFYERIYKNVFKAVRELQSTGMAVDILTVANTSGVDTTMLMEATLVVPTALNIKTYAMKVKELSGKREIEKVIEFATLSLKEGNTEDISTMLSSKSAEILSDFIIDGTSTTIEQIVEQIKNPPKRIATGFKCIDNLLLGGIDAEGLFIIAGTPGTGKTAMACAIAAKTLMNKKNVHFTSLEMSAYLIFQRIVRAVYNVENYDVRKNIEDYAKELDFGFKCQDKKADIDSVLADMNANKDADIFFVDYLGLVEDRKQNNAYAEVSSNCRRFKQFSLYHKKPVVLLCQMNRDSAKTGREPQLYDLRDSGKIEQDADIVTMLWRGSEGGNNVKAIAEGLTTTPMNSDEVKWFVRKNRNGPIGDVTVKFNPAIAYYE